MIAGIDEQADIAIYLTHEETERVAKETLTGVLIKWHKPKRQGTISLSLDDTRKNELGCGIGIDDRRYWGVQDNFHIDAFFGEHEYQDFLSSGRFGVRQRMRDGSKISVYDVSRLSRIDAGRAESLEFYRDNRKRLPEDFG